MIDPICPFHGKRRSEHVCLVCCMCFRDLTLAECVVVNGHPTDVCADCAEEEAALLRARSAQADEPESV